jgi:hypothetical protein
MPNELPTISSTGPAETPQDRGGVTVGRDPMVLLPPPFSLPLPSAAAQKAGLDTAGLRENDGIERSASFVGVAPPLSSRTTLGIQVSPYFQTRQYWEGTVESVEGPDFIAIVRDRTQPGNPDEEVVFELDEVTASDRPSVSPGATFYWFVGAEYTPAGTQKNVSLIQFRRVPRWSTNAIERGKARARRFMELMAEADE